MVSLQSRMRTTAPALILSLSVIGSVFVNAQGAFSSEQPPTSCFVFRDTNRNGTYDLGDRPFGGLVLQMQRPDGRFVESKSNISGFANFKTELDNSAGAAIAQPGVHKVKAFLPPGWISTIPSSMNQEIVFRAIQDAWSGLVPQQPCTHIGLAPQLIVAGKVDLSSAKTVRSIELKAKHTTGVTHTLELSSDGLYQFEALPGNWVISFTEKGSGLAMTRTVTVSNSSIMLSTVTPDKYFSTPELAAATLVEFDDLMSSDAILEIPNGYAGLDWSYWVATHNRFYGGDGYINGTLSGEYLAYNSSGVTAALGRREPFDFIGTYVTAAWPEGETGSITVRGWRDGKTIYEDTFRIWNAGGLYFQADYHQVDKITFSHSIYERVVIDNLSYR